jgi:MFS family permease
VARALIGLGVATCLMAPLKAIATWAPHAHQASLGGWMMVAGSAGALIATAPLEFALRFVSWRWIFVALAVATCASALAIWWRVPDTPKASRTIGLRRARACARCLHIRVSVDRTASSLGTDRSWRYKVRGRCRG